MLSLEDLMGYRIMGVKTIPIEEAMDIATENGACKTYSKLITKAFKIACICLGAVAKDKSAEDWEKLFLETAKESIDKM